VLDLKALSGAWAEYVITGFDFTMLELIHFWDYFSQVALCYESARVLGIDIAPVQSAEQSNCRFEFDSINREWNTEWESVDLVFGHKLLGNIDDRSRLLRNAFNCLVADGFIELWDRPFIYSSKDGAIESWDWVAQQAREFGDSIGHSFVIAPGMYKNDMEAAGSLDTFEEWEAMPVTACLESVLDEIECFLLEVGYGSPDL
jgi:hypothetical protein